MAATRDRRVAATAGGLGLGLAAGFNIANVGPVAEVVARAYGVRLGTVGFLTTALFLTHLAMQIPGGRLVDRLGARTVGFGAAAVIVAGNAVALASPTFALAIVGRLVAGLGSGAGFVAGSDYVRGAVGTPTAQGLYGGASVGGGGLAIAIVPLAAPAVGWRAPYVTALACMVLVGLLALAPAEPPRPRRARVLVSAGVLRDSRLYPLAVAHTASFGFSVILGNWVVPLLEHDGYARRLAGILGALALLGGLVARPLAGRVMHVRPDVTWPLVRASMVAGAVGAVALELPLPTGVRVAGSALVGLAAGVPFAAAFAGAQALRPDAPAAAVGLINTAATLTILIGTPLVGFAFALPGHGRIGFSVVAALWAASAAALAVPRAARQQTMR